MAHAIKVRGIKNELSLQISREPLKYLEISKFDAIKLLEAQLTGHLPSADLKCLIDSVHEAYQNKFKAILRKTEFKTVVSVKLEHYKRNTKFNRIGDLKSATPTYKKTPLSLTLTYLSRYGSPDILDYVRSNLPKVEPKKQKYYQTVLDQCQKHGFERLLSLALSKRQRVLQKYGTPIEFKSLTFTGNNRISTPILDYNTNFNSEIKAFITLGNIEGHKQFDIPVKYSKSFHGDVKLYQKGRDTSYKVCFPVDHADAIRVILSHKCERFIPDHKTSMMGVDVNLKRNMYSTSEDFTIDYDRRLLGRYADELLKLDKLKKNSEDYIIGKQRGALLASLKRKLDGDIQRKSVQLIKMAKALGKDHLVMENLTGFQGAKTYGKDGETELKISRLSRELKISSYKGIVENIASHYDVAVSLIQPEYSSQECPICGCIDRENRKSQSVFCCVRCGYTADADFNSPKNMVQRVSSNVLRQKLLKEKYDGSGVFVPIPFVRRELVKKILQLSHGTSSIKVEEEFITGESNLQQNTIKSIKHYVFSNREYYYDPKDETNLQVNQDTFSRKELREWVKVWIRDNVGDKLPKLKMGTAKDFYGSNQHAREAAKVKNIAKMIKGTKLKGVQE